MNQEGKTCGFEAFAENCSRACFLITLSLSLMQCACWFDIGLGTSLAHGLLHSETATLHLYSPMRPGMCTAVGSVDKMWACQLPIPLRRQPPAALLAGLCIPPCVFDQEHKHKHHKHRHTQARLSWCLCLCSSMHTACLSSTQARVYGFCVLLLVLDECCYASGPLRSARAPL